jgi:hypothetical protein
LVHRSTKFIIVTTAPEDAKIQQAARPLEGKVRGEGRNLLIQVWGWGRVQEEISRFPEAIRAFHPDAQPFTDQIRDEMRETQRLAAEGNASSATGIAVKQTLAQMMAQRPPLSTDTSAASDALDRELPDHIDTYRDLMREGQPRTALQLLTKLKDNAAITGGDAILPLLLHLYNRTKNSLNFDDLNSLKLHRSHVNV